MFYDRRWRSLWFAVGMIGTMILIALTSGCQVDVSGGFSTKALYPDDIGTWPIGDPRRGMYEGSGYGERHTAGSESGTPGFRGMGGER